MTAKLDLPVRVTRQDTRSAWRSQYWVLLFAIYCLGFAIYGADPYVTFNRTEARIFPTRVEWQYPLIVAHVFTGVVTVSLAWVQVWPWLRSHHPRVHRALGRVYLLAGAVPAALLAIPAAILDTGGQSIRVALLTIAFLWLATSILGGRAALQRRLGDHRRWMLRNVALATVVITARPYTFANLFFMHWVSPHSYSLTGRDSVTQMLSMGLWGSLALHLVIVEWFILAPRRRRRAGPADELPA